MFRSVTLGTIESSLQKSIINFVSLKFANLPFKLVIIQRPMSKSISVTALSASDMKNVCSIIYVGDKCIK